MKEIKEIAAELSKGNVKKASDIRKNLLLAADADLDMEVTEIAKQAMIHHLKEGKIKAAKEIPKHFSMSKDMIDETVQQAVLSSFRAGDMSAVKVMKKDLPISKSLGTQIIDYCQTWGNKDACVAIEEVFA
jgi:hypothetical protein